MSNAAACPLVGQVAGPGDAILQLPDEGQIRIGSGLQLSEGHIVSTKAGKVQQTKSGKLWLEGRQKKYIPSEDDLVIGIIIDRNVENFMVDIGAPFSAMLPQLSFEGATKRNRPNLKPGDVVYARVVTANRDLEPELSCVDATGKAGGFGQLKDGTVFSCSTSLARTLLSRPMPPVLGALGSALQFELAVGLNGKVWLHTPSVATTIVVSNAILQSEQLTKPQVEVLVKRLLTKVQ